MPSRALRVLAFGLVVAAASLLAEPAWAQCAMCRTTLAASPEGRSIGEQFNRAIVVMLFAPYVVMAALAAAVFRGRLSASWRRLRRRAPSRYAAADVRPS